MRLYELDVVWESICLTVTIQLLSLPIILVVFLNCAVAQTSFYFNLWTLHNSICSWLPDKQILSLYKHVLCIFRMSIIFSRIWWGNSIWLMSIEFGDIELWDFGGVFGSGVWKKTRQGHVYMCCVLVNKYSPWLTHRLILNIHLLYLLITRSSHLSL